jgi:adenylate kinase
MAPIAINDPFSPHGAVAKAKLLLLSSSDSSSDLIGWARSLHIEHVSLGRLFRGISRTPPSLAGRELRRTEELTLALARRWFFGRKPDAGFVLTDFPATLLQAKVFDEWLETRDEAIDTVIAGPGSPAPVVAHYRALGLLAESACTA